MGTTITEARFLTPESRTEHSETPFTPPQSSYSLIPAPASAKCFSNPRTMASSEFIEELASLDKDEQKDWIDAIEAGQNYEAAHQAVREKYHARFLDIVRRHKQASVFRAQFPAPHAA